MSALEAVQTDTITPRRPASGAERTLQGLYERHFDRIFGFCRRRLRSHPEAEDATQTTFLQAFRALQRGVVPVSEEAWLFKIAENVCLSAHRSNGRRSDRELADGTAVLEIAPARENGSESLVGLNEALASIPPRQRDVFVLRELRGMSYREIAGALGLSVTAVEMLVFRARKSLARAIESGAGLRGRVASIFDLGMLANALKTAFGGATAAKAVSAAAIVAVALLPAGDAPVRAAVAKSPPVGGSSLERDPASGVVRAQAWTPPAGSARPSTGETGPAQPDAPHVGHARRPRPDRDAQAPEAAGPPSPGAPPTGVNPQPHVQLPQPPPVSAPELPELPPVEVPQLPEVPELPQVPELPVQLPDPLPDPGTIQLPDTPTLP